MRIIFVDRADWRKKLLPLSFIRPVSALRLGILTIEEKWSKRLSTDFTHLTESYLSNKFSLRMEGENRFLFIRGNVCPNDALLDGLIALNSGQGLKGSQGWLGVCVGQNDAESIINKNWNEIESVNGIEWKSFEQAYLQINYPEDLFLNNGSEITQDFDFVTKGRTSAPLSSTNHILGDKVFAEEGVSVECAVLNSLHGPIYLGKHSEIWENCAIRGPFSLGENSQVKMSAKIYSNVTVGPYSRVGGELNTCVILGYSSKGHDGYFGSGVMGEWCNWGADTNNSNLKNNYKSVKVYDYSTDSYRNTNQQFYGLIMGDHAKCAINTAFNTGTVVGVGASIFGADFPPTFIPDFAWGGAQGFDEYKLDAFFETAALVYERRNRIFDDQEKAILKYVFEVTKVNRRS
jgi:UDP-N-acetylglucosamine diphosphorylase/glucosamine-1-phosphate N-acetyltransferase